MITFGGNISSLKAQRQLSANNAQARTSFERLSSGSRINRASDDAAGLSISMSLNKNARVYTQAIRNANDGVSALAIAEGSTRELSGILMRLQELAIQSSNGSFSRPQRLSLDDEGEALTNEFNRIVASSTFNRLGLLDGTLSEMRLQVGFGNDGSIGFALGGGLSRRLGTGFALTSVATGDDLAPGTTADFAAGDFNGDGKADLVKASGVYDLVFVEMSNGTSTPTEAALDVVGNGGSVATGDFNGDGKLDFIYSSTSTQTVYMGDGQGNFSSGISSSFSNVGGTIRVADLNRDGKDDLVGISGGSSTITVLLNTGIGQFSGASSFTISGGNSHDIQLGDLNGDGSIDIVSSSNGGTITTKFGIGNGTFGAALNYSFGVFGTGQLSLADLNYDGQLDLVGVAGAGTAIALGRGNGSFGTSQALGAGTGGTAVSTGDVDGDGIVDIVAGTSGGVANVMKGRGDGTFDPVASYNSSFDGDQIVLADLNGDGVNDIIGADDDRYTFFVLQATTTTGTTLQRLNLTTQAEARASLSTIMAAFQRVQTELGGIGAAQSRLFAAISTLGAARETSAAASGRITNADIAQESAEMLRRQMLQQSSSSVLAQANQAPALALTLLQI